MFSLSAVQSKPMMKFVYSDHDEAYVSGYSENYLEMKMYDNSTTVEL